MMLLRLVVTGIGEGPIGMMSEALTWLLPWMLLRSSAAAFSVYFSLSTAVRKGMDVAAFNTVRSMELA